MPRIAKIDLDALDKLLALAANAISPKAVLVVTFGEPTLVDGDEVWSPKIGVMTYDDAVKQVGNEVGVNMMNSAFSPDVPITDEDYDDRCQDDCCI